METANSSTVALPQSQNLINRIIGIFTSPRATMDDIVARPSWLVPLVITVIAVGISSYLLKELIVDQALEEMARDGKVTQEQMDAAVPWIEKSVLILPLIFMPIMSLLLAGVFMFVGNVILGGEARFKTAFSVICWSGIILLLSSIVNIPLMLSRGDMASPTSLAFLAGDDKGSPMFFLFSQLDLFYFWWVAIMGIGFAAAYKFANQKGIITAFACWAVFIALGMGLKAIF
ncbi:MAG: Yip1 family protein [bacterium]